MGIVDPFARKYTHTQTLKAHTNTYIPNIWCEICAEVFGVIVI